MDEAELTYREHEKIGFPAISENDQANILIWHDVEIINRFTPYFRADFIPREVARKYITLSKFRFREFFVKSGYVEKLYETYLKFPKSDGQWVEKTKESKYELKVQERGGQVHIEFFDDYNEVIDYFVNWKYKIYDE